MKRRRLWLVFDAIAFVYLVSVALTYWSDRKASAWCLFAAALVVVRWRRDIDELAPKKPGPTR